MKIQISDQEVTAIRRLNARINGTIGGAIKNRKRAAASRRNIKHAIRARKMALAA